MKKKRILLLFFLLFFAGCSKKEIEGTYSLNSDSGIYDYILGTVKNVDKVFATASDGKKIETELTDDGLYQLGVLSLGIDQTIKVSLINEHETLEEELIIPKKESIDNYEDFATIMNQVIPAVNKDAKTRFPETRKDGAEDIAVENGVTTAVNVYDGNLIGLDIHAENFANNELPTIIAAFQGSYDANNERVAEAYNNTLETLEKNSFVSNGFKFTFEVLEGRTFASIIKDSE